MPQERAVVFSTIVHLDQKDALTFTFDLCSRLAVGPVLFEVVLLAETCCCSRPETPGWRYRIFIKKIGATLTERDARSDRWPCRNVPKPKKKLVEQFAMRLRPTTFGAAPSVPRCIHPPTHSKRNVPAFRLRSLGSGGGPDGVIARNHGKTENCWNPRVCKGQQRECLEVNVRRPRDAEAKHKRNVFPSPLESQSVCSDSSPDVSVCNAVTGLATRPFGTKVILCQLCSLVANAPLASVLLSELALSSLRAELRLNPLQSSGWKIVAQASSALVGGRGTKRGNE